MLVCISPKHKNLQLLDRLDRVIHGVGGGNDGQVLVTDEGLV